MKILEKFYQGEINTYNDINDFAKNIYSDLIERENGPKKSKNLDKLKSIKIKNITEFKTVKELKKFLDDVLEGLSELEIEETGQKISISKSRVKRGLKNARNNINNQVYNEIEDLVRNSKYLGFEKADLKHTKVKGQDLFLAKMKIDDKEYLVEFKADVPLIENKLYYAGHKVRASVSDTVITPLLRQKPTDNIAQNNKIVNIKRISKKEIERRKEYREDEKLEYDFYFKDGSPAEYLDEFPEKSNIEILKDIAEIPSVAFRFAELLKWENIPVSIVNSIQKSSYYENQLRKEKIISDENFLKLQYKKALDNKYINEEEYNALINKISNNNRGELIPKPINTPINEQSKFFANFLIL